MSGDISTHVIEGSAVAFPFDQEFGLSKKETNAVSNRYPVEVTLEGMIKFLPCIPCNFDMIRHLEYTCRILYTYTVRI